MIPLTFGLNSRGVSVSNDLNPDSGFVQITTFSCVSKEDLPLKSARTLSLAPDDKALDLDTPTESVSVGALAQGEDLDTSTEAVPVGALSQGEDLDTSTEAVPVGALAQGEDLDTSTEAVSVGALAQGEDLDTVSENITQDCDK